MDSIAKKIVRVVLAVMFLITVTGCNSREDVEHLSEKKLIKLVENTVKEDVEFVERNTDDEDRYVYIFNLVNRNIDFKVYDLIENYGLNIDSSQFYDNYKNIISFGNYFRSIIENLESERLNILNQYNFEEEYYSFGGHNITIKDYSDLSNLSKYIVQIDDLYNFNIKKSKKIKFNNELMTDSVSFSKTGCDIDGIPYSTSDNSRLTYETVINELERNYIERLKWFGLKDDLIPQNIWNKYTVKK